MIERNRAIGLVFVFVIGVLLFAKDYNFNTQRRVIAESELVEVRVTLTFSRYVSTGKYHSVYFTCQEYPNNVFNVGSWRLVAMKARQFAEDLKVGDTVFVRVLKSDFRDKMTKPYSDSWQQRITNNYRIEPYAIKSKGKVYMTMVEMNAAYADQKNEFDFMAKYLVIVAAFIGVLTIILKYTGIVSFFKK